MLLYHVTAKRCTVGPCQQVRRTAMRSHCGFGLAGWCAQGLLLFCHSARTRSTIEACLRIRAYCVVWFVDVEPYSTFRVVAQHSAHVYAPPQTHGSFEYIMFLGVRPGMQGKGYGSRLLRHVTDKWVPYWDAVRG